MKKIIATAALACCFWLGMSALPAVAGPHGGGGGGHGGGGHGGGGFHGGSFHSGGFRGSSFRGSGFRGGYYGRGYYGRGWGGGYWPYYAGIGLGGYGYGYPYYGYGYSYPYYYNDYAAGPSYDFSDLYSSDAYSAPLVAGANAATGVRQSFYSPPDTSAKATVRVLLPDPNATVYFDDTKTTQTGTDRTYNTPALDPSQAYTYQIRATWMENGHEVSRMKDVRIRAGRDTTIDFRATNQ